MTTEPVGEMRLVYHVKLIHLGLWTIIHFILQSFLFLGKKMLNIAEDSMYQSRLQEILNQYPHVYPPDSPTEIIPGVYIGNYRDAGDIRKLNRKKITHVVNCAAWHDRCPYKPDSGIEGYLAFKAEDSEDYNMMQHFTEAKSFIDEARQSGGKVLIHCAMGINRSGAITVAYIMADQQIDIFRATQMVKDKRVMLLANAGFQRQLIQFARKNGLLSSND